MGRPGIIAIDGPAGAGKSTIAKLVASRLGYQYLDTGAMYRAVALRALEQGVDPNDGKALEHLTRSLDIRFHGTGRQLRVLVDDRDVTEAVRAPEVGAVVSQIAVHPEVREALVALQRRLAEAGGVVVDGRDIGTYVLPHAQHKFFVTASLKERVRRRHRQLQRQGIHIPRAAVEREIEERDRLDTDRPVAPLKMADDAVLIDTTDLSVGQAVETILTACRRH